MYSSVPVGRSARTLQRCLLFGFSDGSINQSLAIRCVRRKLAVACSGIKSVPVQAFTSAKDSPVADRERDTSKRVTTNSLSILVTARIEYLLLCIKRSIII